MLVPLLCLQLEAAVREFSQFLSIDNCDPLYYLLPYYLLSLLVSLSFLFISS